VTRLSAEYPNKPVLSVVTPVFNGEEFIAKALRSVREASSADALIEHIIMDAGSTDRTMQIVEAERRVRGSPISLVVSESDGGQADAINKGFAQARGDYLAWLNADDVFVPSKLRTMVHILKESKADVVLGRCVFVNVAGNVVYAPTPPEPVAPGALLRLLSGWYAGRSIVQPEAFIARSVFESAGGLDTNLHYTMDHEYWLRLALRGATFESHDMVVAKQLVHPGQKTADNAAVVREQIPYAVNYLAESPELFGTSGSLVKRELDCIQNKLQVYDLIAASLQRIVQSDGYQLPVSQDADARVLSQLTKNAKRTKTTLCVALREDEIKAVVGAVGPSVPPVVVGRPIEAPGLFDIVVVRRRMNAQVDWRSVSAACLRENGLLVILGEPDPKRVRHITERIGAELANRLTWNSKNLITESMDAAEKNSSSCWQPICDTNLCDDSLVEVSAVYYGKPADHPMLELASKLAICDELQPWRSGVWRLASVPGPKS